MIFLYLPGVLDHLESVL